MNKTQQGACYGILLSLLLAGIVVFDLIDTIVGWPTKLMVSAVWGGLLLVPIYLIEKKKDPREVNMDERDKRIVKKSLAGQFYSACCNVGLGFRHSVFCPWFERYRIRHNE